MSEEKMDNIKELNDEELENVSGGGYYRPLNGCPHGYTKYVMWVTGHKAGDKCEGCTFRKLNNDIYVCEKTGELEWEW